MNEATKLEIRYSKMSNGKLKELHNKYIAAIGKLLFDECEEKQEMLKIATVRQWVIEHVRRLRGEEVHWCMFCEKDKLDKAETEGKEVSHGLCHACRTKNYK